MTVATRADLTARLGRLRQRITDEGLGGLVVTHLPNIAYLTGFWASAGSLVVKPNGCVLITDGRYRTMASELVASGRGLADTSLRVVERSHEETLARTLAEAGDVRLGFEAAHLSVRTHQHLQQALAEGAGPRGGVPTLVATFRLVEQVRAVKDDLEIDTLRDAARLLSSLEGQVRALVCAGREERQVAAEIDAVVRRAGFERPAFDTIVASGPNSALPHARPGARCLSVGDIVLLDFGGVHDGYCVDLSRVATIGPPGPDARRLHAAVIEAQRAAISVIRPGVWASDVDGAARRVLAACGLGDAFSHGTGHGLGLEIHEEPRVGKRDPDRTRGVAAGADGPLAPGMIFTVEPGAYAPGVGGVRIEDDVLVTADGCEVLTGMSREIWVQDARGRVNGARGLKNSMKTSMEISGRRDESQMVNFDEIKRILDLAKEHGLAEFEIEQQGLRLRIKRDGLWPGAAAPPDDAESSRPITAAEPKAVPSSASPDEAVELAIVKSPIVGTFYRATDPNARPFVESGDAVRRGQVVCIIEAMKLMNEIESEYEGEIVSVFVENGQPVQYGDRLFAIRPQPAGE